MFLKTASLTAAALGLSNSPLSAADQLASGAPHAEKIGWKLGCQAYSFNRFTFYEAIQKTQQLGLHYIEMYPKQRLGGDHSEARTDDSLSPQLRKQLLQRLSDADVRLVNYGVVSLANEEAEARKVFDFAAAMGIETLVSEPEFEALDLIEKLCEEYRINVAIHNHPAPSRYWKPDTVVEQIKGRSKRIGACADTGHWMRSDIDPADAVEKLRGRIISFHLKDLNKYGRDGEHDVPWGTGEAKLKDLLRQIHAQGFGGSSPLNTNTIGRTRCPTSPNV
jgi:sugar phosphate isomerase/epimerase